MNVSLHMCRKKFQRFSRVGPRGKAREWATLGVHPLSWLLSNNRLEEVCGTLTKDTFSSRLLLSNQDKGCTPSVAHSLPLPLPPGFCSTCQLMGWKKRWGRTWFLIILQEICQWHALTSSLGKWQVFYLGHHQLKIHIHFTCIDGIKILELCRVWYDLFDKLYQYLTGSANYIRPLKKTDVCLPVFDRPKIFNSGHCLIFLQKMIQQRYDATLFMMGMQVIL